jgi:histidinol phosphatase-like enzyme (inositol monophosphatase family)
LTIWSFATQKEVQIPNTQVVGQEHWNELADFARRLAHAAGKAILPLFRVAGSIANKAEGRFDPVTDADRFAERTMRDLIAEAYPAHGITGEELENKPSQSRFCWILDPIDGTKSFICGMPTWTTLIALTFDRTAILGVIAQPFVKEMFIGGPYGSWSEGPTGKSRLTTRPSVSMSAATLTTVAPEIYRTDRQKRVLQALSEKTRMTRFGGDAYFFAMLAAGFVDIAMDADLQTYDVAALVPIIQGAGGVITTWEGHDATGGGDIIAAANSELHAAALDIIRAIEGSGPSLR